MASILQLFEILIHLDHYMELLIASFGDWSYLLLGAVIFADTGFVITPFFPVDPMIFVSGSLAALGLLHPGWLALTFCSAAIAGDSVNYVIGQFFGRQMLAGRVPLVKQKHIDRTFAFFDKHGPKTIMLARFVPIVRTFAPFVSGLGAMPYHRFIRFNVIGALVWVGWVLSAGYFFGQIPFVQRNFSIIMPVMVLFSQLPLFVRWLISRLQTRHKNRAEA